MLRTTAQNNSAQVVSSPQNNIPTTAANQDYTSNNTSKNSTDNYPLRANTTETHPKRTDASQDALITNRPKGQKGGGAWTATAYVSGGTVTEVCNRLNCGPVLAE